MIKLNTLVFTLSLLIGIIISLSITNHKFNIAKERDFSVSYELKDGFDYGNSKSDVILYNDEVKYLTWLIFRADSLNKIISLDGIANLNLYGFFISALFVFTGSWKFLFIIGLISYIYFSMSINKVSNTYFKLKCCQYITPLIILSPVALDLSSGFMRDLFLITFVIQSFISLSEKKIIKFFIFLILIFSMRSFYLVLLVPFYIYIVTRNFKLSLLFSFLVTAFSIVLLQFYKFGNGDLIEVVFRVFELLTGASKVLFIPVDVTNFSVGHFEFFSAVYYLIIPIFFILTLIICNFKIYNKLLLFLFFAINLSIFYGYTLGFFVPRTKFIFVVILIFYLFYSVERVTFKNAK